MAYVSPPQVDEIPEQPIPQEQNVNDLPNALPKSVSNHSIQISRLRNYHWLKLSEDNQFLYCICYNWAYEQKRWCPAEMNTAKNSNFPWKNNGSGFVGFKSGLDVIKGHNNSDLHVRAEFALNSVKNLLSSSISINGDAKHDFVLNRTGLKAIFESIRYCGRQGIPIRGHRDEDDSR